MKLFWNILELYQLGPCPVKAVKEGNVNIKYDVGFVFAEVNADTVYWARAASGEDFQPVRVDRTFIGKKTKPDYPDKFYLKK